MPAHGKLNLALTYTPTHKPGVSVSFAKVCDRADIVAAVKKSLSDCSGGMKSPGEGGHNADEQTPEWEY